MSVQISETNQLLKSIGDQFVIYGDYVSGQAYGSGHINDTYCVTYNQSGTSVKYLFQRVNHNLFKDVPGLMSNVSRICEHMQTVLKKKGCTDASRRSLSLIKTRAGLNFLEHQQNYWRIYLFIEDATGYDIVENENQAYEAAKAFGEFQKCLVELPGDRLVETIPDFHNSRKRFKALETALADDTQDRAKACMPEIEWALENKGLADALLDLFEKGLIPERVTHNDTKLNNVLINNQSQKAICVIDLDTLMPGLALYDFGDLVRTSTSPAAEDEKDLNKVKMQIHFFEALIKGYLESAGGFLNEHEINNLPIAGMTITYTIGLRFLTDFLQGDTYFKTSHANHNLERCRTQFKLVQSMQEQIQEMQHCVKKFTAR